MGTLGLGGWTLGNLLGVKRQLYGATLLHALFDVPQLRLQAGLPREIMDLVDRGEPIEQLF